MTDTTKAAPAAPEAGKLDTAKLGELIEAYARVNAEKNGAERREKELKAAVHREMLRLELDHFVTHCEVGGNLVAYEATIADVEQEIVDVVKLQEICDPAAFLALVDASKGAVEKALGADALRRALKTIVKPAMLAIGRQKPK